MKTRHVVSARRITSRPFWLVIVTIAAGCAAAAAQDLKTFRATETYLADGQTLDDMGAPSRHLMQYYEMLGSRAIYSEGWKAVTFHPGNSGPSTDQLPSLRASRYPPLSVPTKILVIVAPKLRSKDAR